MLEADNIKAMTKYPLIVFSPEFIDQYGNIEDVLGKFLETQLAEINLSFNQKYPEAPKTLLRKLLSRFVTLDGTKAPLYKKEINIPKMTDGQLDFCLTAFETARILRQEDGVFELAHDTLALHIAEQRSTEEIAFLEIIKMVKDRQRVFPKTKTLLNANELQLIKFNEALKTEQVFNEEEWAFINKSIGNQNRQRQIKSLGIFLIIGVLAAFSAFSFYQRSIALDKEQEAIEAQKIAEENLDKLKSEQAQKAIAKYNENLAEGRSLMAQNKYLEAIKSFETAMAFNEKGEEAIKLKEEAASKAGVSSRFENLIKQGNNFEAQGKDFFVDALRKYQQALNLGFDNSLANSKVIAIKGKLESAFTDYMKNGDTYLEAEAFEYALEQYEKALRIKPNDNSLKEKIKRCKSKK